MTFLGGASEVGASCTLLQVAGRTLLIDGGMRPAAREGQSRIPNLALLDLHPPEALLITHAHIDHTGALPLIASLYPRIPIYATESTCVLTEVLLRDSVRIMEQEHLRLDGETPLYTAEQVDTFLARIHPVGLLQPFAPLPSSPDILVHFIPAGHILGAAMLYFHTPEGTFLHTGDISVTDQRTIKGLDIPHLPEADLMLCEGTYGNRFHSNRKEEERKLAETVQAVVGRGGRIICPAFAVGRSQEIVLILKAYRASGMVSPVPIYLDGMVRSVCSVYQNQSHDLHPKLQHYLVNARRPLFADPDLHIFAVRTSDRPGLITRKEPAVIISSSGMLTGGASPLYAAEIATREQDCILFTGYQDEESPGAALLAARQGDTIRIGTQTMTLHCQVARYNLSGHADADQIVAAVTQVKPKQLILVHGAPDALDALSRRFPKIQVDIPVVGTKIQVNLHKIARKGDGLFDEEPVGKGRASFLTTPYYDEEPDDEITPLAEEVEEGIESKGVRIEGGIQEPVLHVSAPSLHDLWAVAIERGPLRPWTSVELGQHYYGTHYRPALRPQVEQVLRNAATHFKLGRVGAQNTFQPRPEAEKEQLRPLSDVTAGAIVVVQSQQANPQIALLLSAPNDGMVSIIGDQWKQGMRQLHFIQILPEIHRDEWLSLSPQEIKQNLQAWRKQVDSEWVDLFALWLQQQGESFTFQNLRQSAQSEEQLLAWGLELLLHGRELFRRSGATWTPLEEEIVQKNPGFAQHVQLLKAGVGRTVLVNEQRSTLTGRSNWRLFEICWSEGDNEGKLGNVRVSNVQVVE